MRIVDRSLNLTAEAVSILHRKFKVAVKGHEAGTGLGLGLDHAGAGAHQREHVRET